MRLAHIDDELSDAPRGNIGEDLDTFITNINEYVTLPAQLAKFSMIIEFY